MKRILSTAIAAAASLALVAGCSSSPGGASGGGASGDTIRIGVNYELTGPVASYGEASVKGVELAAEQINAEGGINGKQVELVKYDNKSDTAEATTLATRLMTQDGVLTEIGPATSGAVKAVIPVANDAKIPVVSGSATDDAVTVGDDGAQPYAFRTCFSDSFQGTAMAKYAVSKFDAKSAVVLTDTSSDYSKGLARAFKEEFTGDIVAEESFVKDQQDFNAILTKLKGQQFDVIYLPAYYNEVGLIINQARQQGITAPILGADGYDSPKLAELAGAGLDEVYFTNHYSALDENPLVQQFITDYKDKYGEDPNAFAALGYDTFKFVADAIERAGDNPTGETVKDAMESTKDFEGVTGKFSIDPETHNPIKAVVVLGFQGGEQTITDRTE